MKVLQVIDTLNPGGAERVLVDLANLLAEKRYDVTVMTLVSSGSLAGELDSRVIFLNLDRGSKYSFRKAMEFMACVNRHEVVHVHMRHVLNYLWYGMLFSRCRAKIVFHDHWGDIEFAREVPFYLRRMRNKLTYIGVSSQLTEWATNQAGIPPDHTFLLTNIVRMNFREEVSRPKELKIMMIANFRRTKNIQFAIEVMRVLKEQAPVLDVYGINLDSDYVVELEGLVKQYGLGECVRFIMDEPHVRRRIAEYNLAIHTALSETGPLVLIEYLASQLPFLSYATGEVARQLRPELPLYFLGEFNASGWAQRIMHLYTQDGYPASRLRSTFESFYSPEKYVTACESIYQKITHAG